MIAKTGKAAALPYHTNPGRAVAAAPPKLLSRREFREFPRSGRLNNPKAGCIP